VLIDGVDHMRLHGMFRLRLPVHREAVRKASAARWAATSPEDRSKHAQAMANARWKKIRRDKKQREAAKAGEMTA
jgi:hypothetical protein